jgi:transposase-like protein
MAERGVALSHTTILRWVQRYVPEFEKRWSQYARPVGGSWRCDETYIKVKGQWTYLYRTVDKHGRRVDFLLRELRDVAAAKHFFRKAMRNNGTPRVVTLDAYAASHRAMAELKSTGTMPRRVRIRSSKYLNNVVEQDHRRIKQRIRPMLGFKRFDTAAVPSRALSWQRRFRRISSRLASCPGDQKPLLQFGQLFSPPEIFERHQNAKRIRPQEFAPEPSRQPDLPYRTAGRRFRGGLIFLGLFGACLSQGALGSSARPGTQAVRASMGFADEFQTSPPYCRTRGFGGGGTRAVNRPMRQDILCSWQEWVRTRMS